MDKNYYAINLKHDNGLTWKMLINHIIEKCNCFEYNSFNEKALKNRIMPNAISPIDRAELYNIDLISFQEKVTCYSISQKEKGMDFFEWIFIEVLLNPLLKDKLLSFNKLSDFYSNSYKNDFYNPTFYHDDTPILWTDCSIMSAYILLTEEDKQNFMKAGIKISKL